MRRFSFSLLGVIAVAVILFGINMIADPFLANARLDLTQGHIYTLSPGTKQLLSQLKDPITLRLFYSRDIGARIPSYGAYADRVRQMLQEYARLSHGKIRLEFYNPEPFSDVEDRALAAGLQGVPIDQATSRCILVLSARTYWTIRGLSRSSRLSESRFSNTT